MAPYVMQINMTNNTNNTLQFMGSAFYDNDGDVKSNPQNIPPNSSGNGGALEKVGGSDGLFGLIAYSTPDPNQTLVIYIQMPAATGSLDQCWVGLTNSGTAINTALAGQAYNQQLNLQTTGTMSWSFTQSSQSFIMTVKPSVDNPKAFSTSTNVTVAIASAKE